MAKIAKVFIFIAGSAFFVLRIFTMPTATIEEPFILPLGDNNHHVIVNNVTSELLPGHFYSSCHATANRLIKSMYQDRIKKDQPHFCSIMLTPSRFDSSPPPYKHYWTAVFNSIPSLWKTAGRLHVRDVRWTTNATWECDGEPAIVVADGCPEGTGFIVQCPQGRETRLRKLIVYPFNYSLATKMTYRVGQHVDCELDHPLRAPAAGTKVVGTAYAFGGIARNPHEQLEWVEYHRMIGVQHFYLYLVAHYSEEDWNLLPNLPYITYVPWDLVDVTNMRARADMLSFQIAQQSDVLYRSRSFGVEWVTYNDVDEYLQLMGNEQTLKLDRFIERSPQLGALMGYTFNFGGSGKPNEVVPDYVIEYSYRALEPFRKVRQKCLVRPMFADYYNNHHLSLGNETITIKSGKHWRYNHYKQPNRGVQVRFLTNKMIRFDASLKDGFLLQLQTRVDAVKLMMIKSHAHEQSLPKEWTKFEHLLLQRGS